MIGAAPLGRVYDADLPEEQGVAALQHALRGGVNYIDTAPFYGQGKSEAVLGKVKALFTFSSLYQRGKYYQLNTCIPCLEYLYSLFVFKVG